MINLEDYYDGRVETLSKNDYLTQVGHTVSGKPISEDQLKGIYDEIINQLNLSKNDTLLDLCCGNGLITKRLAAHCNKVTAIDTSAKMIEIAVSSQYADNIHYIKGDALNFTLLDHDIRNVTKVLMYGALQHFNFSDFTKLLKDINLTCPHVDSIFFGFVPNIDKRWQFYDSLAKRIQYLIRKFKGQCVMGTWWSKNDIKKFCEQHGFDCHFADRKEGDYGYPYRFHILIKPVQGH